MDFFNELFASLVSTSAAVAVIAFLGRSFFTRYLDKKFETFKYELDLAAKTHELTLQSQIVFKERQLSEFYGPIYARLKRGKRLNELWRQGKLDRVEADILALFVQSNESNVETILNRSDLIDGDAIPESYIRYLTHVAIWDPFLRKDPPEIPPYEEEGFEAGRYPDDFEESIIMTTEKLKREISELYKEYGFKR